MRFVAILLLLALLISSAPAEAYRLATFSADVTVPIGHGMMGGSWKATSVADPLYARGIIIRSADDAHFRPIVYVAVDWCEIRNDALTRWETCLAEAATTTPNRVLVSAVHQHEAPVADLEAERILRARKAAGSIVDLEFHEVAVQRVAAAAKAALVNARPLTHIGTGQARVEKVASNRRFVMPGGAIRFDRMSRCLDVAGRAAEEGLIDPWLKTLSFWHDDRPLAAISSYAVHPMSYYGSGEISADFPGIARGQRQIELPDALQIYASGASGNVTAGKYNDGSRGNRPVLASRLHAAMKRAWENTTRHPLEQVELKSADLRLDPREGPGWSVADLSAKLDAAKPFEQCLAAMGLSWRKRIDRPIRISAVHFGPAVFTVLPGEAYVEYQLYAQEQRADAFVLAAGYGEGAPGYIPTEQHFKEGDSNLGDWCWVAPGSEAKLKAAIREALRK